MPYPSPLRLFIPRPFSSHQTLTLLKVGILVSLATCVGGVGTAEDTTAPAVEPTSISFRRDVAPILVEHCVACHSAKKAEGGYRIDNFAELSKPGDSGIETLGNPENGAGELLRRLVTEDESERMPAESPPLPAEQVEVIRQWLAAGASFDAPDPNEALSFVIPPPRYPAPPKHYPQALPVTAIAFSPDGTQLLVGGYHEITVWDVRDGSLQRRLTNLAQRTFALMFSPDGKQLAVAGGEPGRSGEVRLVDWNRGEVTAVLGRSADVALDLAFRPGTHQLAIASADSLIRIVDTETLEPIRTLASHADWVTAVAWSPDGNRLVSASRDKSAKVFDGDSGELLTSYQGHGAAVRGVIVSADSQHALSSGADNQLHRWELAGGKRIAVISLGGEGFRLVRADEGFILAPVADKRLLQIDLAKNAVERTFTGLSDWPQTAAWHEPTSQVAAGDYAGRIKVWPLDAPTGGVDWLPQP